MGIFEDPFQYRIQFPEDDDDEMSSKLKEAPPEEFEFEFPSPEEAPELYEYGEYMEITDDNPDNSQT